MVEMTETARILNTATRHSLVILDEIGRGTSTYDGVSLAWAVVEHLHDRIGCRTLFATHYHELTALAPVARRELRNSTSRCREWQDEVVFLHKIVDGAADKSYGIHVARLAGVPREVIERAKQILASSKPSIWTKEAGRNSHAAARRVWAIYSSHFSPRPNIRCWTRFAKSTSTSSGRSIAPHTVGRVASKAGQEGMTNV